MLLTEKEVQKKNLKPPCPSSTVAVKIWHADTPYNLTHHALLRVNRQTPRQLKLTELTQLESKVI